MKPSNSVAVLLHWKAILLEVDCLEEERICGNVGGSANADSRVYPHVFDSHFHLDITIRDMGLSFHGSSEDILSNAPVEDLVYLVAIYCNPRTVEGLVYSVAIYSNPRTYPQERCLQQMSNTCQ